MSKVSIEKKSGYAQLMIDSKPFTILGGELHNSAGSSLDYLEPILDNMKRCQLNTVLVPVSWELVEPREGEFDFALVDGMIAACRERGLKLIPLWFATMKNAISCYTPEWVKTDLARFPRAETTLGTPGWTVSPLGKNILEADRRAFAALMKRIKEVDGDRADPTVIMVQVENESGILNAPRDYSALAEEVFRSPVPDKLLRFLDENRDELHPEMRAIRERTDWRTEGDWSEIFGGDADEVFMAWHIASFIGEVAAAGREVHDIPHFTNAWLCGGPGFLPGMYPSGGPVPPMFDVWHAAAPALDLLAPDIYHEDFRDRCASFAIQGNPLFIPEARGMKVAAANVLYAIGEHRALGFSPFAIDVMTESHPLVDTYSKLSEFLAYLNTHYPEAEMSGFLQEADEERFEADLGNFRFTVRTAAPLHELDVPGSAIVVHLGGDEYMCLGRSLIITFTGPSGRPGELISLDLGECKDGEWVNARRINGDESAHGTGILLSRLNFNHVGRNALSDLPPEQRPKAALETCRFRIFDLEIKTA
jgi:hypothetical protein